MQNPDQYTDSEVIRLLLQGPSGSGKDVVAAQFPKPFVIDIDRNLGNVIRFLRSRNLSCPKFDFIDLDKEGNPIPIQVPMGRLSRYGRLNELLIEGQIDPTVETIVISSGTTLSDVMINEVCRSQGKTSISDFTTNSGKADARPFWNFFGIAGRHFMAVLSQIKKNIVFTVHEKVRENEQGQTIYPIEVAWPGQVGDVIGCFFTQNWRCETDSVPSGPSTVTKYLVRTAPNHQFKLKQALVGIPDRFEFDWKKVEACLKGDK